MRMEKRKFRIGELATHLAVERFVIRFWEKEFNFKSDRSIGGQRFYDEDDLRKFETIKELLYDKKFTIAGAKKQMSGKKSGPEKLTSIVASQVTSMEPSKQPMATSAEFSPELTKKLQTVRARLVKLQQML